jgi:hypothetical protein
MSVMTRAKGRKQQQKLRTIKFNNGTTARIHPASFHPEVPLEGWYSLVLRQHCLLGMGATEPDPTLDPVEVIRIGKQTFYRERVAQ